MEHALDIIAGRAGYGGGDQMNIDITKTYATRSGLPVRIYAVDGCGVYPVHGASRSSAGWEDQKWSDTGRYNMARAEEGGYDLVPAKTWRAWKEGEAPKFFMVRSQDKKLMLGLDRSKIDCFNALFIAFDWLHEDGTTTPCGVLE